MEELHNSFKPMLTPKQMLYKGIFGGTYFNQLVDYRIFPKDWFKDLDESYYLSKKYLVKINLFKIKSGQTQEEWEEKGWIHKDDPRGWFEWYCKFSMGRTHPDDDRQIKRWQDFCGVNGRWRKRIYSRIYETGDWNVSPRIQQSLLHWGYLVNQDDFDQWKKLNNKLAI